MKEKEIKSQHSDKFLFLSYKEYIPLEFIKKRFFLS